jgi:Tol biopolymer transport system component
MPTLPKLKLIPALVLIAALLALPAAANATLAYTTNVFHPHIWVSKNDNGKGAKAIGAGSNAKVAPNGELVVFERETKSGPEMKLYDVSTGKTKTLFAPWRETFSFAWSPDSTMVAALGGSELHKKTLYVIDVESGKKTRIASGYFNGVSFAPNSEELVFGLAATESYPPKSDIFRASVGGGPTAKLTHDKVSAYPLWGPTGQIVFVRLLGAKQRQYGPKNELFLMNGKGQGVKRLTHTTVDPLTQGLYPTAWSKSGNQLLANFGGQDTQYGVAVNPKTGKQTNLSPANTETGFVGVTLTADGKTVLGYLGGFEGPGTQQKIASVPFKGGKPKIILSGAFSPSWGG